MGAPCVLVEATPGQYAVLYRQGETWLMFEHLRKHGGSFEADVTVRVPSLPMPSYRDRIQLQSATAQLKIAQACNELLNLGTAVWRQRVHSSCWLVVEAVRQGPQPVLLEDTPDPATRWLVDRWVPWGLPTVIFGHGGTGKSMVALALAVCARTGQALGGDPNWRVTPCEGVLILDWESDASDHRRRIRALAAGMGVPFPTDLWHVAMRGPLHEQIGPIAERVARGGIDLVIVDSIAPACGAELEASETAIQFMEAVRRLGVTALCIGHVNKAQAREGDARAQIFGSVQFHDQTRSSFQLVAQDHGEDSTVIPVTFRLDKHNLVPPPLPPPVGWAIAYGSATIAIRPAVPDPETQGLGARILRVLPEDAWLGTTDLADQLLEKPDTVSKTLRRLLSRTLIERNPDTQGGRGQDAQWRRLHKTRTPNPDMPGHPNDPPF